jgi:hypothetical protein
VSECSSSSVIFKKMRARQRRAKALKLGPGAAGKLGPVAELVGIEGGVVSGVINLESSDVGASDRRPRHEENYHEV